MSLGKEEQQLLNRILNKVGNDERLIPNTVESCVRNAHIASEHRRKELIGLLSRKARDEVHARSLQEAQSKEITVKKK